MRKSLIHYATIEKKTIKESSSLVGLSPSTARAIIIKYMKDGTFFESKATKIQRKASEKIS